MYHCRLNISVFSGETLLEETARSALPLEQFEHHVEAYAAVSEQALRAADVILLDLAPGMTLDVLRAVCAPGAELVVCLERAELASLSADELAAVDEIWEKPLDGRLTAARFHKLLERCRRRSECRLTRTYLDTAIDSIPDLVWFKSRDGAHVKVNKAFCHTVGKSREDVIGRDHCYIWDVSKEEFEAGKFVCQETEDVVMSSRKTCQFTELVKSQNGMRQFKTYKSPLFDEDGTVMGTVGIGHDETDLENMGTELEIILRSMPFAILVWDKDGSIINANEKFEQFFGIKKDRLVGRAYPAWESDRPVETGRLNAEGQWEIQVTPNEERTARVLETHREFIYDVFHNKVGGLCTYRDVTLERELETRVLSNLNTDFMTGLHNRRYFYQYIGQERRGEPVGLLYVDLDNFKEINDTYGHRSGDEALTRTARILEECFEGQFIARLGGDEFIVAVLGEHSLQELERMAWGLIRQMELRFSASKRFSRLSASVGVARSGGPGMDVDTLIQQSDTALYTAKQSGKGRVYVYQG